MGNRLPINSLVVCVDYDDFLKITLPRNRRHFDRTLVVTSTADARTQETAWDQGVEFFATDSFFDDGATFNKGLAIEKGLDVLGRDGWICVWDADILMPESIEFDCDPRYLYCPYRRNMDGKTRFRDCLDWRKFPKGPAAQEFPGYFHLFHSSAAGKKPWYSINWNHAGGYDSDFQMKFDGHCRRPPFEVLHLGPSVDDVVEDLPARVGQNWCGRTSPRIDDGSKPDASAGREKAVKDMIQARRKLGPAAIEEEHVRQTMPKRMSFFWTGRMSWLRWVTIKSFMRHNPGWDVCLYRPDCASAKRHWEMETDDDNRYSGKDYTEEIPPGVRIHTFSPPHEMASAQMCDWFQWHLLGDGGGFYADMDIVWVKNLDPLYREVRRADAMFCLESGMMAIGFLASRPKCRLFRDMAISMKAETNQDYQHYGVSYVYRFAGIRHPNQAERSGERAIARLKTHYSPGGQGAVPQQIVTVPDEVVYPFDWSRVDAIWRETLPVNPQSYGIHWFGGNKLSRERGHAMTADNWADTDCTLTNYLHRALGV